MTDVGYIKNEKDELVPYCNECGETVSEGDERCYNCGAKLEF